MVPFLPDAWPTPALRSAAEALWNWNYAVRQQEIPAPVREQANQVCLAHNLPVELLKVQQSGVQSVHPQIAMATMQDLLDYTDQVLGSHALLLARLAGERSNWVEKPVREFARATFLTRRLCQLKHDLARGHLWIPRTIMEQARVDRKTLEEGSPTPEVRRLLWKQVVLIRDAYASCRTLTTDLSGWLRRRFRIYWTHGVHLLALIEARRFDVWSKPVMLSGLRRAHLYWQVYVGKSFK